MEEENPTKNLEELKKTIQTLEWDASRNQINPAKRAQLEELKKQYKELRNG